MSNRLFLFILLCLITNTSLNAKNIYVNDNSQTGDVFTYSVGLVSNNGLTKSTPKLTLTAAIAIAAPNDSIYIDAGTYNNEVNLNLTINGVKIVGAGYSATIIDNLYAGTATNYFLYINANNITLKDLQVTGYENNGTQTPGHSGQAITIGGGASPITGILIENIEAILNGQSGGNPAISVLANSTATITGGGSFCNTAGTAYTGGVEAYGKNINLLITDYLLGNNYKVGAFDGGGLRVEGDATTLVTVKRTLISKNIASQGGGISVINGDLKMYDCIIDANSAGQVSSNIYGGGVFINAGTVLFSRCNFKNNFQANGTLRGGAISARYFNTGTFSTNKVITLTIDTCVFQNNSPGAAGMDIYGASGFGNTCNITARDCQFLTAGNYNIFSDATSPATSINVTYFGTLPTSSGSNITRTLSSNTLYTPPSVVPEYSGNCPTIYIGPCTPTVSIMSVSNPTICSGNSTIITPAGASSYTLNPGNLAGTSFTVSPSSNTTYTLTGTSAAGCVSANSATTAITVNTTPTLSIASVSNPTICSGNSTVITPTATPAGASSYTLNPGGFVGTSFTVSPNSNITYTLTGTSAAGCVSANSATTTITVNTTPTVSIASVTNSTICSGNSTTITPTASPVGASTYTLTSATATITTFPFVVSPSVTTTYSLSGTSAAGCRSNNTSTTSITVNTTPTVSIASVTNPTICSGNSTTITPTASPVGASTYTLTSATATITTFPFVVNPNVTTTYSLSGTSATGCVSNNTSTTSITVNTTPTVSIASVSNGTICSGNTVTITPSSNPTVTSYTLNPGGLTGSSFTVSPLTNTTYSLSGTSAEGCVSTNTATRTIVVNATPTVDIATNNLSLCSGNPLVMPIVSGGTVILWQGPNSFTSSLAQPTVTNSIDLIHAGNYSVTVAQTYGANTCTSSVAQVTVSVVTSVNIGVTGGQAQNLCIGSILNIIPTGGNTYTLQPNNTSALNFTLNPTSNTTYTLLGSAGNGCDGSTTFSININPLPVISITPSSTSICLGNSATLTASSGSVTADSYTWSANANSVTNSTVSISPTANDTYTVTGANASTGCTNIATQAITVNTTPTVGIDLGLGIGVSTICSGTTLTLTPSGASTYTINPGNLTGPTYTINPSSSVNYSITGTSAEGCVSTESTNSLTVNPTPTVGIDLGLGVSVSTICSGTTVTLTPSGASTYTINPGNLTGPTYTVNPSSSVNYSITGTSAEGCVSAESTTSLTVNTTPTVAIDLGLGAGVSTICSGTTVTLTPSGASTYTINPGNLTGPTYTVNPSSSVNYSITGTSAEGCVSAESTTSLTVNTTPTVAIASVSSPSICFVNSTVITPNGANSYTLNPGAIVGTSFTVSPTSSQTYSITGTSAEGCLSGNEATSDITVNTTPTASAASNPTTVCTTGSVNLTGSSSSAASTYTWTLGNGITSLNQNNSTLVFSANSLATGSYVYTLTISSPEGCISSPVTTTVSIINTPNSSFSLSTLSACQNQTGVLTVDNAQGGVNYSWTVNGINSSSSSSLNISSPLTSTVGVYPVSVLAVVGTCSSSSTANFTVNPNPNVALVNTNVVACPDEVIQLEVLNPVSTSNYSWSFGSSVVGSGNTFNINPLTTSNAGVYTVKVTDSNGCQAQTNAQVETKDCFVFVPEIFTPNGDGKNDSFVITNILNYPNNNLKIFNRWGSLVYEKDKYNNEFDGHANVSAVGTDKLPAGTYYVILNFNDGRTETYNGYLLLQY